MAKFRSEIRKFIRPEDLDLLIDKMHKGAFVSKGRFTQKQRGIVEDFEWNHLDQIHRNFVHDAYHDSLRIATSKDIAISMMAYKNLPIYIQVADMRIDRGLFYQSYTFFGLLFCHQVNRMIQDGPDVILDIEWRTVSHKWLRFLHGIFNRKMHRLIDKQYREDIPLRARRAEMRDQGFCFKTDEPDYLNSNLLTDMVIFPESSRPSTFSIEQLTQGQRTKIKIGSLDLHAVRGLEGLTVWPAVCPHEGAEMHKEHFCNGELACPWHGRKFPPMSLKNGSKVFISNLELSLENENLVLRQRADKSQELSG